MSSDDDSDYYSNDSSDCYSWSSSKNSRSAKTEINEMDEIELEEKELKEKIDSKLKLIFNIEVWVVKLLFVYRKFWGDKGLIGVYILSKIFLSSINYTLNVCIKIARLDLPIYSFFFALNACLSYDAFL